MRWGTSIIVLAMISGGCAAQSKPPQGSATAPVLAAPARYQPSASGCLVFDPPVTIGQPPLNLSRDGRSIEAFVGYESLTTTTFVQHNDDDQFNVLNTRLGTFERRAVSTKVGVSYR
jgi:hypothetical protein